MPKYFIKYQLIGCAIFLIATLIFIYFYNKNRMIRKGDNLFKQAYFLFKNANYMSAIAKYNEALHIFRENNFEKGIEKATFALGNRYDFLGNYQRALGYYKESLELNIKRKNKRGASAVLFNMANVYSNLSDYSNAEKYYQEALSIYRELKNKDNLYRAAEVAAIESLAGLCDKTGDYAKSLDYHRQVTELFKGFKIPFSPISNEVGKGYVYLHQGKRNEALEIFKKYDNFLGLGQVYLDEGKYSEAKETFEQALNKAGASLPEYKTAINIGLGLSYEGLQDYAQASSRYQKAVRDLEGQMEGLDESDKKIFLSATIFGYVRQTAFDGLTRSNLHAK
jgi:tetratricopeptide (TPR) repeat protein